MSDVSSSFSAWETLPQDEPPLCIAVRRPVSPPRHYEAHSNARGRRYTDALGRSLFSIILSLKHDNPGTCLHNVRPDISYTRTFTIDCDTSGNSCRGLLAVSVEAKSIYVAYRDSDSQKQLGAEILNGFGAQLGAWEKFEDPEIGVISYFHQAFYRTFVGSGMKDHLLELTKRYANHRIWVTGYSLGGSLASMTALYMAKKELVDKKLVRGVYDYLITPSNRTAVRVTSDVQEQIDAINLAQRIANSNGYIGNVARRPDLGAQQEYATRVESNKINFCLPFITDDLSKAIRASLVKCGLEDQQPGCSIRGAPSTTYDRAYSNTRGLFEARPLPEIMYVSMRVYRAGHTGVLPQTMFRRRYC
ncbi:hypothetical protein RB195_024058 [Necator americanus]|uniref:Fungal lipase-type domain-containing protein n=2 Tax=Necator americanus TaxID=51031 RepID=A0ABR1ELN0_NECAM